MNLSEANSIDIKMQDEIALLPIGALEAHGQHLPLGTDNFLAEAMCKKIVEKFPAIILPTVSYGQTWSLQKFAGSFHIPPRVFEDYLTAIVESVIKNKFKLLVFVNAHLGNSESIKRVQREIIERYPEFRTLNLFYPGADEIAKQILKTPKKHKNFFHADELETSYMLYLCPKYVNMSVAIDDDVLFPSDIDYRPILWNNFSQTAVMGNAKLATKEKGEKVLTFVIDNMLNIIKKNI